VKVAAQEYAELPLDELETHPQNPRRGNVDVIAESIDANGFYGAVIVQKATGYVLAGNHRLQAARAAGAEKVPAIVLDVDDETATRILLADNRTNDAAGYDDAALAELLGGLETLHGTGFTDDDLAALADGTPAVDLPPPPANEEQDLVTLVPPTHSDPTHLPVLRFAGEAIPMTSEEAEGLRARLRGYVAASGSEYGFVRELLWGGDAANAEPS
jgi:ParB-like chromosome segregation protein Spo0J